MPRALIERPVVHARDGTRATHEGNALTAVTVDGRLVNESMNSVEAGTALRASPCPRAGNPVRFQSTRSTFDVRPSTRRTSVPHTRVRPCAVHEDRRRE